MATAPAIAALKAWALAQIVLAAVHIGQWRALAAQDPAAPPPASPLITNLERAGLALLLIAIILTLRWWQQHRPGPAPGAVAAIIAYGLAAVLSLALWAQPTTLAQARQLHMLDAATALLALWPALSLTALIRHTAPQP